jgi:GT2 family glycosyltransferase
MDELDLIDKVEALLKNKLKGMKCIICGSTIVYHDDWEGKDRWKAGHSPYIEVRDDEIDAGYRCNHDLNNPVIVFRISRRGARPHYDL